MIDQVIDLDIDDEGDGVLRASFATETWEFNVRATAAEFAGLDQIRNTDWPSRQTLRIGTSAGSAVFWSSGDGTATILLGHDDETWDIAIAVPLTFVDQLLEGVKSRQRH